MVRHRPLGLNALLCFSFDASGVSTVFLMATTLNE
jgi:hypothetical protein